MGAYSGVGAYLSSSGSEVGTYSGGGLIREWGLNRSFTVLDKHFPKSGFECKNPFIKSYLYLLSLSWLVCEFSCQFNETLILKPIFLNLYSRYKILIYCCHI